MGYAVGRPFGQSVGLGVGVVSCGGGGGEAVGFASSGVGALGMGALTEAEVALERR